MSNIKEQIQLLKDLKKLSDTIEDLDIELTLAKYRNCAN